MTRTTRASTAMVIPLFEEMDHTVVESVSRLGTRDVVHAGRAAVMQGYSADSVLLVERGWLGLTYLDEEGTEVLVAICGVGCAVGDQAALADTTHQFGAVALTDVYCRRIDRSEFTGFARNVSGARDALQRVFARRLSAALGERTLFMRLPSAVRVARVLTDLVHFDQREQRWTMPFALRQDQLADLCCVGTRTVEKTLSELRNAAVIRVDGRPSRILVENPDRLREIARWTP